MTDPDDQITNEEIRTFINHLKDKTAIGLLAWMQIIEESTANDEGDIRKLILEKYELDSRSAFLLARIYKNMKLHGTVFNTE